MKKILNLLNRVFLDKYELNFVKKIKKYNSNIKRTKSNGVVMIQAPVDYYYLLRFHSVLQGNCLNDFKVLVYWPYNIGTFPRFTNKFKNTLYFVYSKFGLFLDSLKWKKLYYSIGGSIFFRQSSFNPLLKIMSCVEALKIFKKLESKEDLENLSIDNIKVGDLVYDSYLRFCGEATVHLDDNRLLYIIYKTVESLKVIDSWNQKYQIKCILNSYSTYIHHGLVVRYFLNIGVDVYTDGNINDDFKKLSANSFGHVSKYENYKNSRSNSRIDKTVRMRFAKELLEKRFNGEVDKLTGYMKKSAFTPDEGNLDINPSFSGVVFLHDFVDSPHIYKTMVFPDFWEWSIFTLDTIKKYKLDFAIKPHPNQRKESIYFVEKLKSMYPDLIWLDSSTSNHKIFSSSGMKFGVSVYGTVIYELAYHGIIPISTGDHPAIDFDIGYNAKTKEEYLYFLTNLQNLHLDKEAKTRVLEFYYEHASYSEKPFVTSIDKSFLKKIDPDGSESLSIYINALEKSE